MAQAKDRKSLVPKSPVEMSPTKHLLCSAEPKTNSECVKSPKRGDWLTSAARVSSCLVPSASPSGDRDLQPRMRTSLQKNAQVPKTRKITCKSGQRRRWHWASVSQPRQSGVETCGQAFRCANLSQLFLALVLFCFVLILAFFKF